MGWEGHGEFQRDDRIALRIDVQVFAVGIRDAAPAGLGQGEWLHGHGGPDYTVFPGDGAAIGEAGFEELAKSVLEDGQGKHVDPVEDPVVIGGIPVKCAPLAVNGLHHA